MPIKLPKGFQRRKSSGNVLDEVNSPSGSSTGESSFRVLERPASKGKSFDGGLHLRMSGSGAPQPPPKDRYDEGDTYAGNHLDATNRGSGATERSLSTAPYDSAASSARLSSSSTNPSSVDTRSDKNVQSAGPKPYSDIPVPPPSTARPGFLRSPPKSFSFGMSKTRESPTSTSPVGGLPSLPDYPRHRTVTESTASTATPPRLHDSDLALEESELDGFENMFDHIGSSPDPPPSRVLHQQISSSPMADYPPSAYPNTNHLRVARAAPPKPISIDRSQPVESSPYSWTSHDGLLRSPSPSKTITQLSPVRSRESQNQSYQSARYGSMADKSTPLPTRKPVAQRWQTQEEDLHPAPLSPTKSTKSRETSQPPAGNGGLSPASVHSATFDPDIAANAQLANMYQETKILPPRPPPTTKVMTPAQWEQYKKQKEMDSRLGALSDDSGSDGGDNSSDEDELERGRQAAQQRRKQEAHLAVYRQKMMKVTGETDPQRAASSLSLLRPGSSPELNRMSHMTLDSKQSGRSSGEDEEDEDVPLGILQAHGFPSKNRPPTRMTNSPSNSNLRNASMTQGAPSVRGGALPAFARQLPADPYYGAGLVNPSHREQLSMHAQPPPQGAGPSTAHPIHPSGLVGVIAGEERARAARRGSPNAAGNYDMPQLPPHPGMPRSQTAGSLASMGYPPGMPMMPGMPPMLTPGDQAQIQMANQMQHMMQVQMQWMQQMAQQMGGQQFNPSQMMPPQFPGQQQAPDPRPQSMHMQTPPPFQSGQRTMSTLNPSMAPWNSGQSMLPSINVNGNYAPSIAPSERSNIGLASRYRPVSTVPDPEPVHRRASTFTSTSVRPWSQTEPLPRPATHGPKPSVNTIGRRSPLAVQDDEDDEEGWAEMKKKRDKKQKNWALRKGPNALQELYNPAP